MDQIARGSLVLPRWLLEPWGAAALLLGFYESLSAPYAAFMRSDCEGSPRVWLNVLAEAFFFADVVVLCLGARAWAAMRLGSHRLAWRVAISALVQTNTFYWRVLPCLPLLLYPALDCESASFVQLLWMLRLRRGRQHMLRLKNNIALNWDLADLSIIVVTQILLIHLGALAWHRAGEADPNGWLHRHPEVAALPASRRYLRSLYWATVTTSAVG